MGSSERGSTMERLWWSSKLQFRAYCLFLLSSLIVCGLGAVEEVDKTCKTEETCLPSSRCKVFQEKLKLKDELEKGSAKRTAIVNQLKNEVCNKKERAFCCPCEGNSCVLTADCPPAQQLLAERKRIKSSNPTAAAQILSRLKANICNKEEKKICCPLKSSGPVVPPNRAGLPSLPNCGGREDNGAQIVGGIDAEEGEFPWAVLLGQTRKRKRRVNGKWQKYNETRWSCGGTLITKRVVLTAAHCQGKTESSRIQIVRLGEWKVAPTAGEIGLADAGGNLPPEQDFMVGPDDVKIHEGYDTVREKWQYVVNDIALIFLPRPAQLNSGVQLVCLPHSPAEYRRELGVTNLVEDIFNKRPTVVGWGYTSGFDPYSQELQGDLAEYGVAARTLQKLDIPALDNETCTTKFGGFTPRSTQLCAGGENGKDSCKGDSGGGLFIQREQYKPWFLIGVVSFGSKKCGSGVPGIYTRVEDFVPWIEENILLEESQRL